MRIRWQVLSVLVIALALLLAACEQAASPLPTSYPGPQQPPTPGPHGRPTTAPTPQPSPIPPTARPTEVPTVLVYFGNSRLNPGIIDCTKVFPVMRTITSTANLPKAALQQLFAGPTEEEKAQGYVSNFSAATRDILHWVKIKEGTAYVNLRDIRTIIPNASASCASAAFFAEVETTLKGIAPVDRVIYAIDGDPATFYEWMQIGCAPENDNCDKTPFMESIE